MLLNSRPVRFLITRLARANGFLDPVGLVSRMRRFAQPSEVGEPIELLRAGMLFHARGLVNTRAIQNNLDWIWPHWVERQFNPADVSFIPRAFSFSHINLTHRNWTAVGLPGVPWYPIVDGRGLVTPNYDGWSLDFWFVPESGPLLAPCRSGEFHQSLVVGNDLEVRSVATWPSARIEADVRLCIVDDAPSCRVVVRAESGEGHVAVALRPYNPEGISFVHRIALAEGRCGLEVDGRDAVQFDREPSRSVMSTYKKGDAAHHFDGANAADEVECDVGLATAVALFPCADLRREPLQIHLPVRDELHPDRPVECPAIRGWRETIAPLAKLRLNDDSVRNLFEIAVSTIVLLTPDEVYPGPFTYKRFWFRDAAFMLNALLTLGDAERVRKALGAFAKRQRGDGYFLSQEGEWDSNGEAIWTYHRFVALTGESIPENWLEAVGKGARWIQRKRLPSAGKAPVAGLFPAGFSAEHLGPNDYYFWDDFWGVAGLRCAAELLEIADPDFAAECQVEADEFLSVIERAIPSGPRRRFPGAVPAAPTRRMDSGAVGSLVADYPLQIFSPGDERMTRTADYLRDHSSHGGGFFQHMIHSGINPYLSLHIAQVRLRAGDVKTAWELMDCVAGLASSTGQWPEAIHPRTLGGCMGDGQHGWAAAEWVMFLRNCFVREEHDELVIASGIKPDWWRDSPTSLGPVLTSFGGVTVHVAAARDGVEVSVDAAWHGEPAALRIALPGFQEETHRPSGAHTSVRLTSRI